MEARNKSPLLRDLIRGLRERSRKQKAPVWEAVARGLNRPRRRGLKVNVYRLEKFSKAKETVAVPGDVLGSGEIRKALTVGALRFSPRAREKITRAGGKCLSIEELAEKNPKGSKVRIMG
jgi:large subunit ribosomal protein L18e